MTKKELEEKLATTERELAECKIQLYASFRVISSLIEEVRFYTKPLKDIKVVEISLYDKQRNIL